MRIGEDYRGRASEACAAVLCVALVVGLLAGTIWMLVGAYR